MAKFYQTVAAWNENDERIPAEMYTEQDAKSASEKAATGFFNFMKPKVIVFAPSYAHQPPFPKDEWTIENEVQAASGQALTMNDENDRLFTPPANLPPIGTGVRRGIWGQR